MKKLHFLSILFAICLLFSSCSSFSRHTATNTEPINTAVFLNEPEEIIRIVNEKEEKLSQENADTIYKAFLDLIKKLEKTSSLKTQFHKKYIKEWKKENTCFEFRYSQRRNYTGSLDENDLFVWGNLQFDAFLFVYYAGNLIAVPYLKDNYVDINGLFLCLVFSEENLNDFMKIIQF